MSTTAVALPRLPRTPAAGRRRPPAAVLAAGALCVVEAVALLALGLTSLDALWGTGLRPPGVLVAGTLVGLAAWVVLVAAGGACLVDGAGHRLLVGTAVGELAVLAVLAVGGASGGVHRVELAGHVVALSAVAVTAAVVPLVKLLLGTTPAAGTWTATTRRPVRAPRPPLAHRRARALTLVAVAAVLTTVALTGQPAPAGTAPTSSVDSAH
ncbi:hypothetical protein [Klenkia taihuensis]|uniref:Uncharacterized protein n=1 Tax=Klenkia taihuensis TaxID=1225127 RepID=A0A1I1N2G5_9ACTN|nr:hypothetical protein [Klenkia taihuensis]GHE12527.1 hypothetical protein GCM10011381_30870 [Klenkia taihuensis]SFC87990.1 hypothetical protein SAMN05661030_1800 [Klenkia taihuensis]